MSFVIRRTVFSCCKSSCTNPTTRLTLSASVTVSNYVTQRHCSSNDSSVSTSAQAPSPWLSKTDYLINEEFTKSNAFGEKKTENGFGRVDTPPRPSDSLTSPHVFVTNLRKGTAYQLLRNHMSAVGEVKYARVYTKKEKQYSNAMVEYYSLEDAEKALSQMHGSVLEGNSLWVREFRDRETRGHAKFY